MRFARTLLTVSALCATMAACGQPFSVEAGDGAGQGASDAGQSTASSSSASTPTDTSSSAGTSTGTGTGTGTGTSTPATPPAPTGLCGTDAKAITYAGQAEAVVKANCTACHGGSTAPVMTDYASAKTGFSTGGGSKAVAAGSMPLGLTLTENQKCILTQWAANNYAP